MKDKILYRDFIDPFLDGLEAGHDPDDFTEWWAREVDMGIIDGDIGDIEPDDVERYLEEVIYDMIDAAQMESRSDEQRRNLLGFLVGTYLYNGFRNSDRLWKKVIRNVEDGAARAADDPGRDSVKGIYREVRQAMVMGMKDKQMLELAGLIGRAFGIEYGERSG